MGSSCPPRSKRSAARHAPDRHHRRGPRPRLHPRPHRPAAAPAADRGLSAGGRGDRPVHAGLRRRPEARHRTGRDRRHPADVRRRPAFLAEGPAVGARRSRCRARSARSPWRPLLGMGLALADGLVAGRRAGLRPRPLGRQHRRAAAGAAGAPPGRDRPRPHRRRLADRRGPGDGARPGPAPAAGRAAGRQGSGRRDRRRAGSGWLETCSASPASGARWASPRSRSRPSSR